MLSKPHKLFEDAMDADYAIGAFNTSNMEISQAIIQAAVRKHSPVIVQTSEGAIKYAGLRTLSTMIRQLSEGTDVPVVLHLDHGKDIDTIIDCIDAGYTSVMYDGSQEEFQDNKLHTREVVDYAHPRGIWVEAELGTILGKEGLQNLEGGVTPERLLTDPGQAKQFVEETGVDALAVSVGTIHGAFTGQEYIRFELLQTIQDVLPRMPLVLHGASGISDEHLRKATSMHVCKVNIDTELRIAFEQAVRAYMSSRHDSVDPRNMLGPARDAVRKVVEHKIDVFGSARLAEVY